MVDVHFINLWELAIAQSVSSQQLRRKNNKKMSYLDGLIGNLDWKWLAGETNKVLKLIKSAETETPKEFVQWLEKKDNDTTTQQYLLVLCLITMRSYRQAVQVTEQDMECAQTLIQRYLEGLPDAARTAREVMRQIWVQYSTTSKPSTGAKSTMTLSLAPPPAGSIPEE